MARKPKGPKTITDNWRRKTGRWIRERRGRGARAVAVLALLTAFVLGGNYGLHWANGVDDPSRLSAPSIAAPQVEGTTPVDAARITGAATERGAQVTAQGNAYASERAAAAAERTGRRTLVAAVGAGILAFLSVLLNGLNWRQTVSQQREERLRADRLHVTEMLDKAAAKLGDDDDSARTLAVHTLERVYNDAALLRDEPSHGHFGGSPTETLQRAVIETLCGYIRDRSRRDYNAHEGPGIKFRFTFSKLHDYRSPNSIKAAIGVLGRCDSPPPDTPYDLERSVLSGVSFRGRYGDLRLSRTAFGEVSFAGQISYLSAADCKFTERTAFWSSIIGGGSLVRSVFEKEVIFDGSVWSGQNARFDEAEFRGPVHFTDLEIHGDHRIDQALFAYKPDLSNVRFGSEPPPVDHWWSEFVPVPDES